MFNNIGGKIKTLAGVTCVLGMIASACGAVAIWMRKNLEMRVEAENGAPAGKTELAQLAKQHTLDAIHDTVHEMARDEARHGKAFEGLLKRYFGK